LSQIIIYIPSTYTFVFVLGAENFNFI